MGTATQKKENNDDIPSSKFRKFLWWSPWPWSLVALMGDKEVSNWRNNIRQNKGIVLGLEPTVAAPLEYALYHRHEGRWV
jgi:hypothetical protein